VKQIEFFVGIHITAVNLQFLVLGYVITSTRWLESLKNI
jgi:hypothetical protein